MAERPRWRRLSRILAELLLALLVLVALAAAGYTVWLAKQPSSGAKAPLVAEARKELRESDPPSLPLPRRTATVRRTVQTYLLIGSDARPGEHTGRSDVLLLVRWDQATGSVSMLPIPRDLRVEIPGHGTNKVNAALAYGGPALALATVKRAFGVEIDHFLLVDFQRFQKLVDVAGGVWLPVDQRYLHVNDGSSANNFAEIDLRPGYQRLSGRQALAFVRYRHGDSDFVRSARQELFLRSLREQIGATLGELSTVAVLQSFARSLTSDLDSPAEFVEFAKLAARTSGAGTRQIALEGNGGIYGGVYYFVSPPAALRRATLALTGTRLSAPAVAGSDVVSGDHDAASLLRGRLAGLNGCVPTVRAAGSRPALEEPVRRYLIDGAPAVAYSQRLGPGQHYLLMQTSAARLPVSVGHGERVVRARRTFFVERLGGRVERVVWEQGNTTIWLTNTLRHELSESQLLAIAVSCG